VFRSSTIVAVLICLAVFSTSAWSKSYAQLGNAAFEEDKFREAIDHYQQALNIKPSFAVYVNLGHCYARLEQWADAAGAYQAAIELDAESVTADVWRFLGQARYNSDQFQRAMDAFFKAVSLEPDHQGYVWIARCMIELEQWIQAQSVLLGRLGQNPHDTETLELLAFVVSQQGDWRGVIDVYRQLITAAPQRTKYRIALANALVANGQNRQAIDVLEFAWRVDRSSAEQINRLLADLYLAEDMPQEAAASYAKLIAALDEPSAEDYYRLGAAYFQSGELPSAEKAFQSMRQADPAGYKAELYLGHIAAERDSFERAQLQYQAAIGKNPTSAEGFLALANLQMKNQEYAGAAANFAEAFRLGDNRPQVHYNRIRALMRQHNNEQTEAALKTALAEHPSDEWLLRLLDRYVERMTPK
jgi:tetratricopeptide (TPR) repeat protein